VIVDKDCGESWQESIRTDAEFPFVGKPGGLEPSGTYSVTGPSVLQFDRVDFQALRSTALWDVGDRWELCAPKWSSYGSCFSSGNRSAEAGFTMEQATRTPIVFNILQDGNSVLDSSGVRWRCPRLPPVFLRSS